MSTHNSHTTTVSEGVLPGPAINTPARVSSKPKRLSSAKQRKLVEAAIERLVDFQTTSRPGSRERAEPRLANRLRVLPAGLGRPPRHLQTGRSLNTGYKDHPDCLRDAGPDGSEYRHHCSMRHGRLAACDEIRAAQGRTERQE